MSISIGQHLKEKLLDKGWTQTDLAYAMDTKVSAINQILSDKRSASPSMIKLLSIALNCDPLELSQIQAEWELSHVDEPSQLVSVRSKLLEKYPLREMEKRGWISSEFGSGTIEEQVCKFFNVNNIDEIPHMQHSAKKSNYDSIPPEQLAWLFRVKKIADEMITPQYSQSLFAETIEAMSTLRDKPEGVQQVPRLLEKAGVRFVVVEGIPNSAIDGVCFWLNDDSPVIGMSLRYDRIDNFWFVLRHECAHVLHGHGKSEAIVDCDIHTEQNLEAISEEEKVANLEASDFCVPSAKMNSFYLRKKPYFSERDVIAFSIRMNVHPGLVVGQLQNRMQRYDFLRKHLVKIRATLSNSMMMDGWGDLVPVEY